MSNEFGRISKRAMEFLSKQEGHDVDFKRLSNGLEPADLVAFANSEFGGAILIGVDETQVNGCQRGQVVGCDVGDKERQAILSKAESCNPPIHVEINIENTEGKPFFRIEIPSGKNKPYCTSRGTYVIRGDGRTSALFPSRLLAMFMDSERAKFIDQFREATKELEGGLQEVSTKVTDEMSSLVQRVRLMEADITGSLHQIHESAENAENLSDEAVCFSDETLGEVKELDRKVSLIEENVIEVNKKLDALLEKYSMSTQK